MGGTVTILARFKDNTKMAFRISTGCLLPFHDLNFLDEDKFKVYVKEQSLYRGDDVTDDEHTDYYNSKSFFAPYDYGLLFFDFKEKHVWSSNNYNGFFSLSSWLIKQQYNELAYTLAGTDETKETFTITEYDLVDGQFVPYTTYHYLDVYTEYYGSLFYMQQVLDRKGTFIYKGNPLPEQATDLYSILAYINGQDLLTEEKLKTKPERVRVRTFTQDICDVNAVLPDWFFHDGDGSKRDVQKVLDYLLPLNILTDKDLEYWDFYFHRHDV